MADSNSVQTSNNESITVEQYENTVSPLLDIAAQLIMDHPDIPDHVDQAEVLGSILTLKKEMNASLRNRVPEQVKLQEEIDRLKKQADKLKDTNNQLFLLVGKQPDPSQQQANDPNAKPKRSFAEIKQMIDAL